MTSKPSRVASRPLGWGLFLWACAGAVGACAPTVKRDLSQVPAGQIGFDDLCGLQTYHDDIEANKELPPTLVNSTEFEGQRGGHALRTGRTRFAFQGRTQLTQLRRVLEENWSRIPESVTQASRLDLEVYWSERDGLRRVVSTRDATVIVGKDEVDLPYHVCLSELLYGAPLYHQRREVLQLPPLTPEVDTPPRVAAVTSTDGGHERAGAGDAGVTPHLEGQPPATTAAPPPSPSPSPAQSPRH